MTALHAASLATGLSSAIALARAGADARGIRTLVAGTITVAVTSASPSSPYDPQLWIRRYLERFAEEHGLAIACVVVPFDQSWLRASRDEVDVVATNVASFPDRAHAGATFSAPFLVERRALRIHAKDRDRFAYIDDFVGKTVGVVRGTAAERDVHRRAPDGVKVVAVGTFGELYEQFEAGGLDAVAEAEYYALDGRVIPSHGPEVLLIDLHDLTPGEREESAFVVRDKSTNLLAALNRFIARTRLPTHIYIQLGMWDRVVASNDAAYGASVKWVERKRLSLSKRDFHSLEWGQYGTLQLGQYGKARDMVPLVEGVAAQTGDVRAQSYYSHHASALRGGVSALAGPAPPRAAVRSRGRCRGSPDQRGLRLRANQLVAAGFSAAHLGQHAKAEDAALRLRTLAKLRKDASSPYEAQPLEIMAAQVEGLSKFLKGDKQEGLEQLAVAAQLEERLDPPGGPAYPIKPSHELYAEALLLAGREREAKKAFETALSRTPRRSLSLLGLARAALGSGDTETAAEAYAQLATSWAAADPGRELDEVNGFRPLRRVAAQP